jgi:hypothetical protein
MQKAGVLAFKIKTPEQTCSGAFSKCLGIIIISQASVPALQSLCHPNIC